MSERFERDVVVVGGCGRVGLPLALVERVVTHLGKDTDVNRKGEGVPFRYVSDTR